MTAPERFAEKSDSLLHRGHRPYMTHHATFARSKHNACRTTYIVARTRTKLIPSAMGRITRSTRSSSAIFAFNARIDTSEWITTFQICDLAAPKHVVQHDQSPGAHEP